MRKFILALLFLPLMPADMMAQQGPYVDNYGVPVAPAVYPTAATAGLATNAIGTVSGSILPAGLYVHGLAAAWTADSFDADNDGAAVPSWTDVINGNVLSGTGLTYSQSGCGGRPGVHFTYGNSSAECAGFLSDYSSLNNAVTMFVVARDLTHQGSNQSATPYDRMIVMGSSGGGSFKWLGENDPGNGAQVSEYMYPPSPSGCAYGNMNAGGSDVMAMCFNGTYYQIWQNGLQEFDGNPGYYENEVSGTQAGIGSSGNLYLGSQPVGGEYFGGYIGMLLVYTNCLTRPQIEQNNAALCRAFGKDGNTIMLEGDSVTINDQGLITSNYTKSVVDSFPGWVVGNCGRFGQTSTNSLNYMYDWEPEMSKKPGHKICVFMERVNDDNGVFDYPISVTETNYVLAASCAHTNFTKFIACTIPSYAFGDADGTRMQFNSWLRANWRGFADAIADYAAVPSIGTNGACSNQPTLFYTDYTHPLAAGYVLMSNVEVQAIQSVISPTANQFGTFYPSNTFSISLDTNEIPVWGSLLTYSNAAGSWPVRVMVWNSNGTFMVQDPAQ